ncbi:TPA: hypothetical protein ACP61Y_004772 [Escherichia coli]
MASINTIVKRKQYLWLGIVVGHRIMGNTGTDVCLAGSDHREISGATRKNEMYPGGKTS